MLPFNLQNLSCVDHITIFHVQLCRRLRFAHPLSVKEKRRLCSFEAPDARSMPPSVSSEWAQSGRLIKLVMPKTALLTLDLEIEMDIRVAILVRKILQRPAVFEIPRCCDDCL